MMKIVHIIEVFSFICSTDTQYIWNDIQFKLELIFNGMFY